jgi:nucleoside-diphosphate-sugar epimerase
VRIIVTGHTGFVGSYLLPILKAQGHDVKGVSRSEGADVLDARVFEAMGQFDIMIHLAALSFVPLSFKEPGRFYYENITATLNCLEACRTGNAKMIFISSYIYGHPVTLPIGEDHPVQCTNPYMESKYLGEQLCRAYHRDFKVPVCIIRPFNLYGEGQGDHFLIPTIINQIPSGEIRLQDPRPKRDFVHVADLAAAIVQAMRFKKEYSVYNIGSGESTSIGDIIEVLKEHSLIEPEKVFFSNEQRANEVLETRADIIRAMEDLDWKTTRNFSEELVAIASQKVKLKPST